MANLFHGLPCFFLICFYTRALPSARFGLVVLEIVSCSLATFSLSELFLTWSSVLEQTGRIESGKAWTSQAHANVRNKEALRVCFPLGKSNSE
jgi:hypothetical protein